MFKEQRHELILKAVNDNGAATVEELAKKFSVVGITVRRDLDELAEHGLVKRTHGGALAISGLIGETAFGQREIRNAESKQRIAEEAVKHVKEEMAVFVDAGTTNLKVALEIKKRLKNVRLITNSIRAAAEAADSMEVILLGGGVKQNSSCTIGPETLKQLDGYYADIFFLSIDGIDPKQGFTTTNSLEVAVKQKMIERSKQFIAVADASKIGLVGAFKVGDISAAKLIITGKEIPKDKKSKLALLGPEIITV